MIRSVPLRVEPTLRQTAIILGRVEEELARRGARVERTQGRHIGLKFSFPPPWKRIRLGPLAPVTTGRITLSAAAGGPWRLQYELDYPILRSTLFVLSIVLLISMWGMWDRTLVLSTISVLWLIGYGVPYLLANIFFRRLVASSAHEVVERRKDSRVDTQREVH